MTISSISVTLNSLILKNQIRGCPEIGAQETKNPAR